jgi:hypothetical protein
MSDERLDPEWHANVYDYLYVSFTNAAAFSPTDTLPLSRWAKMRTATDVRPTDAPIIQGAPSASSRIGSNHVRRRTR